MKEKFDSFIDECENDDVMICYKGCNHRLEDCLCGCEECQEIDRCGNKYGLDEYEE